jgi:hypothetical protein
MCSTDIFLFSVDAILEKYETNIFLDSVAAIYLVLNKHPLPFTATFQISASREVMSFASSFELIDTAMKMHFHYIYVLFYPKIALFYEILRK